ncbi:MAG: CTP synthase [Oscillospiraceae bacterium]|jgi:CTP synthase|nr:CTP synthase [Oscillospiraceae bacterium]
MATKYIFVTGGVVSGLGKGITAASLGRLLKARGLQVRSMKMDPYLNLDPGTMNPRQHGEVFVTEDGAETDLDLGHYERFIDENLNHNSVCTSGTVFDQVLRNEREGVYEGKTVQIIPHITGEMQRRIALNDGADVVLVEIGGTVGDIESQPFLEAIRQFSLEHKRENCMFIHVTLLPYLSASKELKTKATQHSVKELLQVGISPDVIVCRTEYEIDDDIRQKISLFCNVPVDCVIENRDLPSLYEVPLALEKQHLADVVIKRLGLVCGSPDLTDWCDMVRRAQNLSDCVHIALVGKYIELHDSYLSVVESLTHAGIACGCKICVDWVDSETLTPDNLAEVFADSDGILVPGGFGHRGIEGKILAAGWARRHRLPYLGICLGMQVACIEFARNVLGLADANSTEFDERTPDPVIDLMPDQRGVIFGGTMRLGKYPCALRPGTKIAELYGTTDVSERHRHRYEFNNNYRARFEDAGLQLVGISPDGNIVEMVELAGHPYFAATQAHPEFKSRPNRAHPLFVGLVSAALARTEG